MSLLRMDDGRILDSTHGFEVILHWLWARFVFVRLCETWMFTSMFPVDLLPRSHSQSSYPQGCRLRFVASAPAHLLASAKADWKRLARELYQLGVLTRLDRATLAGYCQAYGRWVEAEKKLKDTPCILKMPSGYIQANPWLTIATKQMEIMQRFATELGMTPSSRSRVETVRRCSGKFDGLLGSSAAEAYFNGHTPSGRFSTAPKPWEFE